jgi:hypothetical protein
MEASLNSQPFKAQPSKVMTTAIADGWPFESELGKLICVAESAYGSLESNP